MDRGAVMLERAWAGERPAGETAWWIDPDGRVREAARRTGVPLAAGRVCNASGHGVIEQIAGRDAALGVLPRSVVDALADRFPGIRWAIADVTPAPAR